MTRVLTFLGILAAILFSSPALSQPPKNADPALAPFFQSLTQPVPGGGSCCGISDCRFTEWRIGKDGYEAFFDVKQWTFADGESRWIPIPNNRVLHHQPSPTGEAVLCASPVGFVFCFLPGSGA